MRHWIIDLPKSPYVLAAAYFTGMTVLMTWPLVTQASQATVSQPGDNLYWIWQVGWVEKALFSLHQSPFVTNLLNYPEGWWLASTEISPLMLLLALPFSLAASPTLGYNVAALISFALSGLLLFTWVFRLTGSRWGALIGGTIFAFFPFRFSHFLAGHLNMLATPALIAAFMCVDQALQQDRGGRRWATVGGVCLGLVGLSSMYYLYMSLVMIAFYLALDLTLGRRERLAARTYVSRLLVLGAAALPILLLAILPYVAAASRGLVPTRGIEFAASYSGSPSDYLLPFTGHPLWGRWVGDHFNRAGWIEASLYPGVVASGLAFIALLAPRRTAPISRRRTLTFAVTSAVAFLFSLGVTLHWAGWPVALSLPEPLAWLNAEDGTSILMPGYLLYKVLPFYGSLRVPMRYAVFVELFLSVLAGCGAAWLLARAKARAAPLLGAAVLGFVLLDFLPPRWNLIPVAGRPVDVWLRQQPADGAVAQFPFLMADEQGLIYATLVHEKPYIGALYGSFPTPQFRAVKPILDLFPSAASLDLLRDLGVRYVVIDMAWYDDMDALDDLEIALTEQGLVRAVALDGQLVYLLDTHPDGTIYLSPAP